MIDIEAVRSQFPALERVENGHVAAYLDGPGGTQVPQSVIDAMSRVLTEGVSNLAGGFGSSDLAVEETELARQAMADMYNCDSGEVIFGQNMTSLTFAMSRGLAKGWSEGDAIVLTSLDHDANFTPWAMAAEDRGVEVRVAEFDPDTGELDPAAVIQLIDESVQLVAVPFSSNALGTRFDVAPVSQAAHAVGAMVFVDAVHGGPHHLIDVEALGCDMLVASVYKFFGPHTGVMYGRGDLLASTDAYKVRPAPSDPPGKFETGTQSFESLAGVTAAVDYIASLGSDGATRRGSLEMAFAEIRTHEHGLGKRFVDGLASIDGAKLWGVPVMDDRRSATFGVTVEGHKPRDIASHLASLGVYVWNGHYYAVNVMRRLGVLDKGGLVRIGFVHYNTEDEVDRALEGLATV